MKILKNNKNIIGLCLTIFILIFLFQLYKKKSLKNSIETYAVYIGNTGGVGDATKHFKFKTKMRSISQAKPQVKLQINIQKQKNLQLTRGLSCPPKDDPLNEKSGCKNLKTSSNTFLFIFF